MGWLLAQLLMQLFALPLKVAGQSGARAKADASVWQTLPDPPIGGSVRPLHLS